MILKQFLNKLENKIKTPLARNTYWMLLGQLARLPIQAIYFILIARSLGPKGYGAFVGVAALVAILSPFVSFGSGHILIKNVSRNEASFQSYWGKALFLTFISGIIFSLLIFVIAILFLPSSISIELIISISIADLLFTRLLDIATQAYQSFNRLARTSQFLVLPNIMRLVLLLFLLIITSNPTPTLWGYFYLVSAIISSVIGIYLVNRELGHPIFSRKLILSEKKEGIYFSIALSSQNIYNDIDKTFLTRLATLEAAGIYSAAYRLVDVSFIPIRSLLYASYARFFQNGKTGIEGAVYFAARLLPYAAGYGLLVSIVLYLLAPLLPYILGASFNATVSALQWLSLLPFIKVCHYFAADSLTGAGFQGVRSICQASTAIFNVLLVCWLVPTFSWKGAAWASLLSDSFLALALWGSIYLIGKRNKATHAT